MTTASFSAPIAGRAALPAPGRTGALLAALTFPLWVVCFLLLYGSLGAKPETTPTLEELHASAMAAGLPVWLFGVLSMVASLMLAVTPAVLGIALARRTGRWWVARVLIVLAVITGLLQLWNTLSYLAFLFAGPAGQPVWAAVVADGTAENTLVNAIAWSLSALAVPVLGWWLWRAGVVPRAGLVVGLLGAVLCVLIVALQFGQPMTPSILLFVLGIALLRPRT